MVITKLHGGLGNQMFQYSLGRKLSLKLGTELLIDDTIYESDRRLKNGWLSNGMIHFNVEGRYATPEEIAYAKSPHGVILGKAYRFFERAILRQNHIRFEPWVLRKKGVIFLHGFWQSEKYFKDIRPDLLKDLSLKKPFSPKAHALAEQIKGEPYSICIQVRRGDYVADPSGIKAFGSHCNQQYYKNALAAVVKKNAWNPDLVHVFVSSDDTEWVKKNLDLPYKITCIVETESPDYERLILSSLCHSHVIANSTFGWWSAWLSDTKGKTVAAPSVWAPGIDLPIDDILPPEWLRIDSK